MVKKLKFYFIQNRISCLTILSTIIINTIYAVFVITSFDPEEKMYTGDIFNTVYPIIIILNGITTLVCLGMIVTNSLSFFTKNRIFKYTFHTDNIIIYLINPLLILYVLGYFLNYTIGLFYPENLYYNWKDFFASYPYMVSSVVLLVFVVFIGYFSTLIIYRKQSYYSIKYVDGKRKIFNIALSIVAAVTLAVSSLVYYDILTNLRFDIFAMYKFDFMSSMHIFDVIGIPVHGIYESYHVPILKYSVISNAMYIFTLCMIIIVIVKSVSLVKNRNVLKFCRVSSVILVVIMVSFSTFKSYRVYQISNEALDSMSSAKLYADYQITLGKDVTYEEVLAEIDSYNQEVGINEYDLKFNGFSINNSDYSYSGNALLFDDYAKNTIFYTDIDYDASGDDFFNASVSFVDSSEIEDYNLIAGENSNNITEVVITEEFANLFINNGTYKYETIDEFIGKVVVGRTIVGVMEGGTALETSIENNEYIVDDYFSYNLEYSFVTNSSFTEEAYNAVKDYEYNEEENIFRNVFTKNIEDGQFITYEFNVEGLEIPRDTVLYVNGFVSKHSEDVKLDPAYNDLGGEATCRKYYQEAIASNETCIYNDYIINPKDAIAKEFKTAILDNVLIGTLLLISVLYLTSDRAKEVKKNV